MTRIVTLILVDPAGELLGALPPFEVQRPWWQEVAEFTKGDSNGNVQVLRLLYGDRPAPPGGHVTYLAQTDDTIGDLAWVDVDLSPHPLRAPYAEPGGPAASIAWAAEVLGGDVTAHQQRTWNLSAIWRINEVAWLKQVPAFFAHEPTALRLVAGVDKDLVPPLLATGADGRMLLAHVPGEDRYGAGPELCAAIAAAFHPVQAHFATHPAGGIPDGRPDAERYARGAEPHRSTIPGLGELIDDLPRRLAAVAGCGLPDTLVHGDLHPGNVRTDDRGRLTIMDWGDSTISHPAFDILRLTGDLADPQPLLDAWADRWRADVPGCDPLRAVELLRPVAALRGAAAYAGFLDLIEPAEWPYHAADVPDALAAAASIVGG